jgi:signal transduction histidine kinase
MLTIEKLTFLAEDIIDLSKYELKELVPYRNKFSLSETVKSVVDLYTSQIKQKGLRLELNFYQ